MDNHRIIFGSYNITGNNLRNVGNTTVITNFAHAEVHSGPALTLESKVAFSALLNSAERYPAPHCHPDTRIAAKKVVKDWIAGRGFGSEKRIMWISGGPGVGKFAILQTICETLTGDGKRGFGDDRLDLEDDEGDEVGDRPINACYFFGRGMGDREKAIFFPATIAYQLVLSRSSCDDEIRTILAKNPSILLGSFPSQFRKLVLSPAKVHATSESPVTVVIDALDECDNPCDQIALLDAILEGTNTANMRFVIASRPEEDIYAFFQRKNVSQRTYHIRLDGVNFKASRDIEIFLRDKFAGIRQRRPTLCPRLPNGEEWPGSIVIYRLRDDSDGQFIYSALVIAFIDTSYPPPDQQLKSLLATPPARAFLKLDALYHHILSRFPPDLPAGSDEQLEFRQILMEILRVIVSWPLLLSIAEVAAVLDKEVDVVQAILRGPMCSLFTFHSAGFDSIITLCHKSLRDYLLDYNRSQEFFLSTADSADSLYIEILSRRPPSDPSQSYSRDVLVAVLNLIMALGRRVKVPQIPSFLNIAPGLVEGIILGPTRALFKTDYNNNVGFFNRSFREFLLDPGRAKEFVIQSDKPDTLFIQNLSRQPSPDPSPSYYSPEVLMGVLRAVVALDSGVAVSQIATLLYIAPSLVKAVVFGPAKALFELDDAKTVSFSHPSFRDLLLDAGRAGDYSISSNEIDSLFVEILSRQPPSDLLQSYSREALMGVLTVVVAWTARLNMPQSVTVLDVAPISVEAIVFGPAKALFKIDRDNNVGFSSSSFKGFLLDADRAGEYFISDNKIDSLFIQILSRQRPSDPLQSYSRQILMGVLTVVATLWGWAKVSHIASFLDLSPTLVEDVIFGPAKALFKPHGPNLKHVSFSSPYFAKFLLDANRAGEYFISRNERDSVFIRILSRQPPSDHLHSYSRDVLRGVMRVLVVWSDRLTIPQIASTLDIDPAVVKDIVFGLPLFYVYNDGAVDVLPSVQRFLEDASCAREFYVPPKHLDRDSNSLYTKISEIRPNM